MNAFYRSPQVYFPCLLQWFTVGMLCWTSISLSSAQDGPETLPKMTVTSNLTPTPVSQSGSAVTVITAEEIKRQQVIYVSDILRNVPGLAVNQSGGSFGSLTQVRIRGAEGNQTLVRLNGIEINDPSNGSEYDFGNLLSENIERIEIVRGPQSALYGSDAIGGIIDIITKDGKEGLSLNVKAEGGSFGTYQVGGGISGGWEDILNFSAGATRFESAGISIAASGSEKDGNENVTAYANLSVRPLKNRFAPLDNLEIGLNGRLVRAEQDIDGFQGGVGAVDANNGRQIQQNFARVFANVTLFEDNEWVNWEHFLSAANSSNKNDNLTGPALTSQFDGMRTKYAYQTDLLVSTPMLADSDHRLSFLIEHERDQVRTASAFSNIDRSIDTTSYVGEYGFGVFDRLFMTGSVRFDDNDPLFDDFTTYRATASYRIKETGSRLHASYGTGVKNPTIFELFGFNQNFQGNPNLTPEKSRGWDAGIEQSFLNSKILLDATYFNNRIESLIQGTGTTAINLSGRSRIEGVEVALQANLMEDLDLRGSYTWTSSLDASGNPLVRRPEHIASANMNYGSLLFGNRFNFNVGIQYNGNQTDTVFDASFNRSFVTLQDYALLKVAASYEIFNGIELFVRGQNLLDENYQEVFSFASPRVAVFGGIRATSNPLVF